MVTINYKPSAEQVRSFARVWFPLFVAAFGAMSWWRTGQSTPAYTAWGVGALLWAVMLASAPAARLVFIGLMWVTYPIGLAVSYVALAVMFFAVFTPIALIMRLAGRDPLALRARSRRSHWLPYSQDDRPERAFRQF